MGLNKKSSKLNVAGFSIFLCDNHRVYSLGNNDAGQCGQEESQSMISSPPKLVTKLKNIKDICCGSTFVICLDFKHKIWCFGDNSAGYLVLSHNNVIFIPLLHPF